MKELKGYEKIALGVGEEKRVSFKITEEMLKFWTANKKYEAENGGFTVWIGEDSSVKEGVRFRLVD